MRTATAKVSTSSRAWTCLNRHRWILSLYWWCAMMRYYLESEAMSLLHLYNTAEPCCGHRCGNLRLVWKAPAWQYPHEYRLCFWHSWIPLIQHFETATAQQLAAAGLFQTIPRWARHKGSAPVTCGCSGNLGGRDGSILAFPSGLAALDSSTANLFVASDSS